MNHDHNQVIKHGHSENKREVKWWRLIGFTIIALFVIVILYGYLPDKLDDDAAVLPLTTDSSSEKSLISISPTSSISTSLSDSIESSATFARKSEFAFSDMMVMVDNTRDTQGIGYKILKKNEELRYGDPDISSQVMKSKMVLIPSVVAPGDVILVRSQKPISIEWQDKKYMLKKFGLGYYAYLPIAISLAPGKYQIGDLELEIAPKKFETQYIQVNQQMESMQQNSKVIEADQKKINTARSTSYSTFLFQDTFISPLEGLITTPYGSMRYVNGKLSNTHRALDIKAPEGTPIVATNDGIVALADELYLTGNSIYIDHGMYLFSQYAHMSKLLVKTGDFVKRGEVIGLVGTTGFSTGPHLHFTFWANSVPVNPNLFIGKTPFQWIHKDDAP